MFIVFAVILLGVVGFGHTILRQPPAVSAAQPLPAEATRDFFLGRWQVERLTTEMEVASLMEYFTDGTFSGKLHQFTKEEGRLIPISGSWTFSKLRKDEFRLALDYTNGAKELLRFRVLDHDRIHNLEYNYVAIRIPV